MEAIERKMIEKTIDCIEKYGIEKVTIRLIAQEAGVNSAAVSYYFRSKENLIAIALNTALENAFEWHDFQALERSDGRALLKAVLGFLADGALKFPNLTKAFITGACAQRAGRRRGGQGYFWVRGECPLICGRIRCVS